MSMPEKERPAWEEYYTKGIREDYGRTANLFLLTVVCALLGVMALLSVFVIRLGTPGRSSSW